MAQVREILLAGRASPLPCPFCGTPNPEFRPDHGKNDGCVQCDACGAIGPDGTADDPDGIKAWNRAARWSDVDVPGGTERDHNVAKTPDPRCNEAKS